MTLIPTKWSEGDYISKRSLMGWWDVDTTDTPARLDDLSGNGRHLLAPTHSPNLTVIEDDYINGLPAMIFDGTADDPLATSGSDTIQPKHVFIIAGYEDASFPSGDLGNGGLVTGLTTNGIMVGNVSSDRLFDFDLETYGTFRYKRLDIGYAENDMKASFNGQISIYEFYYANGYGIDGIQLGRDRNFADRRWKGPFCEMVMYSAEQSDGERQAFYEYVAMKYRIWREVASGLHVWPFQPDWPVNVPADKAVLSSRSVTGRYRGRSKSTAKETFDAQFTDRTMDEYVTAKAFWDQHYPGQPFIYRDDSVSPSVDHSVLITSPFGRQQSAPHNAAYAMQFTEI